MSYLSFATAAAAAAALTSAELYHLTFSTLLQLMSREPWILATPSSRRLPPLSSICNNKASSKRAGYSIVQSTHPHYELPEDEDPPCSSSWRYCFWLVIFYCCAFFPSTTKQSVKEKVLDSAVQVSKQQCENSKHDECTSMPCSHQQYSCVIILFVICVCFYAGEAGRHTLIKKCSSKSISAHTSKPSFFLSTNTRTSPSSANAIVLTNSAVPLKEESSSCRRENPIASSPSCSGSSNAALS